MSLMVVISVLAAPSDTRGQHFGSIVSTNVQGERLESNQEDPPACRQFSHPSLLLAACGVRYQT